MRRACIDTHALIWYMSRPRHLGRGAARWLRDAESAKAEVVIPAAVVLELALLRERGRRVIGPVEVESLLRAQPGLSIATLDLVQVLEFVQTPRLRELFDRMIVGAARALSSPLLTSDAEIIGSGLVETIWD